MSLQLEDHIFAVLENQDKLYEFLGEHDWNFRMSDEVLRFYPTGGGKVLATCPVQLIGSESKTDGTWLWAWANVESNIPESLLKGARRIRDEGQRRNDPFFTASGKVPLKHTRFGGEIAILCTSFLGLFTYYACPYEGGTLYTAIETCPGAQKLPSNAMRKIRTMTAGISVLEFDHKSAVAAYLGQPLTVDDHEMTFDAGADTITVSFDTSGRISDMRAAIGAAAPAEEAPSPADSSALGKLKSLFRKRDS